jgi:hypothetical protein
MIKNYSTYINEELTNPYEEDSAFVYSSYFNQNYDGFRQEIIDDLKNKLVGKKVYLVGERQYNYYKDKVEGIDNLFIEGIRVKPIYHVTIKDVQYDGSHRGTTYYVNVIDDEGKIYKLKKIVDKKSYDKFAKKFQKELDRIEEVKRKKEKLKLKHAHHDPFGEENWDEDD